MGLTPPATPKERWLHAAWQIVVPHLPTPPASVVELGCGPDGGLVPRLAAAGYTALGVDPEAPDGPAYQRVQFEQANLPETVDAVVACTALHHVDDPGVVVERIARALGDAGVVVVVEWEWEAFDERTARWCFDRLGPSEPETWLHRRRKEWVASGQTWRAYLETWATREGLHPARELLGALDRRFERRSLSRRPYAFADLAGVEEADERAAIARGDIRAMRIDYVGALGGTPP